MKLKLAFAFTPMVARHALMIVIMAGSVGCRKESVTNTSPLPPAASATKSSIPNLSHRTIDDLIEELNSPAASKADPDDRVAMIREIGARKAIEAIPFLVTNLTQISPVHTSNAVDYAQTYPCSAALVQIGEPAVPLIQSRFSVATSNEQLVFLATLIKIKGAAFVAEWIDSLPKSGARLLPEQRRAELKQWVLSQAH